MIVVRSYIIGKVATEVMCPSQGGKLGLYCVDTCYDWQHCDHLGRVVSVRIPYGKVSIFLLSITQYFGDCDGV